MLVVCRTGGIAVGGAVLGPGDALAFEGALAVAPQDGDADGVVVTIRRA